MRNSMGGKMRNGITLFDQDIKIGSTFPDDLFMNTLRKLSERGFSNAKNSHMYLAFSYQSSVISKGFADYYFYNTIWDLQIHK